MASKYWIKLWIDILYDPKMGVMSDRLFRRTVQCFLLAGEINQDGLLPSLEDMAWVFRLTPEELEADLVEIAKRGILDQRDGAWLVVNFEKRQSAVPASERMRLMRESKKKEEYYGGERYPLPDGDADVTNRNTDTDTDTETDTEVVVQLPDKSFSSQIVSKTNGAFKAAVRLASSMGKENPENWAYAGFKDGWIWDYEVMKVWKERHYDQPPL